MARRRRLHPGLRDLSAALSRFDRHAPPAPASGDPELLALFKRLERFVDQATGRVGSVAAAVPLGSRGLDPDEDLQRAIAARARTGDPAPVADARRMLAHLESLHALMDLARRAASRGPQGS